MDRIITSEKAAHWYLPDGTPFYEVPCKSRPGEMRPATITDARKAGAVPSVTTILKILDKPQLDAWRVEQGILSALTLHKPKKERLEDFAHRVAEDAQEEGAKAAEEGSRIHEEVIAAIENCQVCRPDDPPFVTAYVEWATQEKDLECPRCEVPFACAEYGGRIDLLYETAVVDIKTQDTVPGKPFKRYAEHPIQMAAYAEGVYGGTMSEPYPRRLISLLLSRNEPGRWEAVEYTADYQKHLAAWRNVLALWKYLNNWQKED